MDAVGYLAWVQHRTLPMKVSTSQEIRLVSALKVAGLIEARMEPAPDAKGRLWPAAEATIFSITEEGLNVLWEYATEKRAALGRLFSGSGMPIDYLREIADAPFPNRVEDKSSIKKILSLKAAGFLEATVSYPDGNNISDESVAALVLRITPLGRKALDRNST
jgi:hypothetical protein